MNKKIRAAQQENRKSDQVYNSEALLRAYQPVAEEMGRSHSIYEAGVVDEDTLEDGDSGLLYTHKQALDAYWEGTVEAEKE